jgi:MoxR-like ATPase
MALSHTITVEQVQEIAARVETRLAQVIVGQDALIRHCLVGLLASGHILLEGAPGLGKNTLVQTLAQALGLSFARLPLTSDLTPGNLVDVGIRLRERARWRPERTNTGTLFANLVLADEINRAAPRTQTALMEAMQDQAIVIAHRAHPLPQPFVLIASQNPHQREGTHPLSLAQIDRFLFNLKIAVPDAAELGTVLDRALAEPAPEVAAEADGPTVLRMIELARGVVVDDSVRDHAAQLLLATHPDQPTAPDAVRRYVRCGAGPRGAQALLLGGRVVALLAGRGEVAIPDLHALALPSLRHRIVLNAEARANDLTSDGIIEAVLDALPEGEVES